MPTTAPAAAATRTDDATDDTDATDAAAATRTDDATRTADADAAYLPISDYGVIGNLHTAALVCKEGGLDFLSFPRFDSATAFAKLLDAERGGTWSIMPHDVDGLHTQQYYEPDSAILVTRYMHEDGVVELTDFMPPVDDVEHCQTVRCVRALIGSTRLRFHFQPRYPYGAEASAVGEPDGDFGARTVDLGPHPAVLLGVERTDVSGAGHGAPADAAARDPDDPTLAFDLLLDARGAVGPTSRFFILQSAACQTPDEGGVDGFGESLLAYTREFWRTWTGKIAYDGRYRETIIRSAITLKLCTSAQYGSSVAAVTFGLPEELGGERNWDYRYSWIRDSAFTMYAMLRLGLKEESRQFIDWIEARCTELEDAAELSLMYRVDGSCDLEEYELDLEGYRGSRPVRAGNGAAGQRQLDIYGELIDTVFIYDGHAHEITYAFWRQLTTLIEHVCDTWREGDHGIWESRGGKRQYTMSKVMAWVAIDRGIRIAQHRGFPAPLQKWFAERDEIYRCLYGEHYDTTLGAWTQYPGSGKMDASTLMMPLVRFVAPEEPNWCSTLATLEEHLVDDCLVKRYDTDGGDGLSGDEGYFSICTCWYIEVLAKAGRLDEAERHLAKFLSYANHLGLYSEEVSVNGLQLGNYPQAFTHLGLISAILQLEGQQRADLGAPEG